MRGLLGLPRAEKQSCHKQQRQGCHHIKVGPGGRVRAISCSGSGQSSRVLGMVGPLRVNKMERKRDRVPGIVFMV